MCGIIIQVLIARYRSADDLGIFNQSYAVYILASQIAAWGIPFSVMHYTAYHKDDINICSSILCSACLLALIGGIIISSVLILSEGFLGTIFSSPATARGIYYSAYALPSFTLNKVFLFYLNGLRLMKALAIFQSLRYILITTIISIICLSSRSFEYSMFSFLFSEVILFIVVIIYFKIRNLSYFKMNSLYWFKINLIFGTKSIPIGFSTVLNTRVDILILGIFMTDSKVGIYAYAIMLLDGFFGILMAIKDNFNPLLVSYIKKSEFNHLKILINKTMLIMPLIILLMSTSILVCFYILATYLVPVEKGLMEGFIPLLIILSSVFVPCIFMPFNEIMVSSGRPGKQAIQNISMVGSNIFLNILLIPFFGLFGAAIGTASSYFIGFTILLLFTRKSLNYSLLTNRKLKPLSV